MAPAAKVSTRLFVSNVALFGSQISQALHNFASLEDSVSRGFRATLKNLDATVHALNRLSSSIGVDEQHPPLFSDEGLRYVETLTEECLIAINTLKMIAGGESEYWFNPKYWKSVTSIDENGHKVFVVPELDEVAFFQTLKQAMKSNVTLSSRVDANPGRRLEELQLLLLLVVQVVTVRDMTNKLPSGDVDLKSVVEYHSRIKRAAEKAHLTHRSGRVLSARSRRRKECASSSSDSDSEGSIRYRSRSPPRRTFRPPPPPSRPLFGPSPPGWQGPPPPPPLPFTMPMMTSPSPNTDEFSGPPASRIPRFPPELPPPAPFARVTELAMDCTKSTADHHPPSYSEKEKESIISKLEPEKSEPAKDNHPTGSPNTRSKEADEKSQEEDTIKQSSKSFITDIPIGNDSRLLKSSSFFGVKFKSLFRTKSSLEAEMKETLADANASLTAFVVQHTEFSKIPHSAFHSLEYTHMRTILSQLKDNTWFKAFYDMTDAEHESLDHVMEDRIEGGRCYKRELIVLKVLQQNRFNAWARVIEQSFRSSRWIQHFENYRIILAIVREKDSGSQVVEIPPTPPAPVPVVERYPPPNAPRVPDPLPTMPRDGRMIVDLEQPAPPTFGMGRRPPPSSAFEPSRQMPFRGPPPFPPQRHPSFQSPIQSDITPRNPITEERAREVLTSYTAYTLRPAPVQQSPIGPLGGEHPPSWVRCFLSREHESRSDLLQRVERFKQLGLSVIGQKLQLTEPQSSQITRLVEDVNHLELDNRFEHKIVELSLVDRVQGVLLQLLPSSSIDVIHLIMERALKDGCNPMTTYDNLMRYPVSRGPPPPPPPPPVFKSEPEEIVIVEDSPRTRSRTKGVGILSRSSRRRSLSTLSSRSSDSSSSTYSESDSDSSSYTVVTCDSGPEKVKAVKRGNRHRYASSIGSGSSSGEERKCRWKIDPTKVRFTRKEVGKDVVQLLLDQWTPVVGVKGKKKEEEGIFTKTRPRNERKKAMVEDSFDD